MIDQDYTLTETSVLALHVRSDGFQLIAGPSSFLIWLVLCKLLVLLSHLLSKLLLFFSLLQELLLLLDGIDWVPVAVSILPNEPILVENTQDTVRFLHH